MSISLFWGNPKSHISVKESIGLPWPANRTSELTINEFVDEREIVLDALLVDLAEVTLADIDEAVAEFKDECRVGVCPVVVNAGQHD